MHSSLLPILHTFVASPLILFKPNFFLVPSYFSCIISYLFPCYFPCILSSPVSCYLYFMLSLLAGCCSSCAHSCLCPLYFFAYILHSSLLCFLHNSLPSSLIPSGILSCLNPRNFSCILSCLVPCDFSCILPCLVPCYFSCRVSCLVPCFFFAYFFT